MLAIAAAVEGDSEHPLAKAIVAEAISRNLPPLRATDFQALPGRGAQARVDGKIIVIGGPRLLVEARVGVPPELEKLTTAWPSEGKTRSISRRIRLNVTAATCKKSIFLGAKD